MTTLLAVPLRVVVVVSLTDSVGGASMLFHDGEGPLVVLARVTLAGVRHARTDSGGGGGRASGGELLLMTED